MKYTLVLCSVIASISGSYAADSTPENALSDSSAADDYIFEPELFRGGRFSQSALAQLVKKNSIAPGKYRVDVSVNSHFVDNWIGPYISRHFLSLYPLLVRRRRYSRGERYPSAL
ncbi:MAG: hypothetical protein E7E41_14640, partial [Klebsiella oxytoca]|nr:hypothetical protein [Klebsiella oxytoca]MDU3329360.1 hypothetical protein [Klebsiella oxytoca]MDU3393348.1 hypothetical protein [Klebsiella oxytoca]